MDKLDAIYDFIRAYRLGHDEEPFKNNIEENAFITMASSVCEIVSDSSYCLPTDYSSIIENTYNKLFVPIVRSLVDMNMSTQQRLEDILKYGQKVTLIVKDVDKTVELIKDSNTDTAVI